MLQFLLSHPAPEESRYFSPYVTISVQTVQDQVKIPQKEEADFDTESRFTSRTLEVIKSIQEILTSIVAL